MNLIKIHDLKVFCNLMIYFIKSIFIKFNKLDVVDVKNQINSFFRMYLQADILLIENEI